MSESDSAYHTDGSLQGNIETPTSGTTTPPSLSIRKDASSQYKKLSQLEHILIRPDTYIGSIEKTPVEMWCYDVETEQMVFKEVTIVPGLYKIFDEILVNAADNKIRDPTMKNIKVKLDPENNVIEVMNDGRGIPVEIHKTENIYIPELIFGNLLTSSNYDDDEKKVTGGRNGYGAKLCNIFSSEFTVETADIQNNKSYKQTWTNNMSKVNKPKITTLKTKKEFTKITFKPDLARFDMDILDDQIISVMTRRVFDLCGTVKDCNIYLNGKKLNIKNFKSYVDMYVKAIKSKQDEPKDDDKKFVTLVHQEFGERWEIAFAVSDGTFNQVSFVNSIATTSGGTHVKFVSDQIINKIVETLNKKEKDKSKLRFRPQDVRNNMFLFINCLIENPAFTSQTKEQLTTKVSQFGGKPSEKLVITDQFIAKILKTSITEKIREISEKNEDKALQKDDGSRKQRVKGQVKLVDANKAGTRESYKCTLILTEGDSALGLATGGLTVVGRDYYGCFPLKGKLLNVREASTDQVSKNAEISALKKIIGLQHKKHYTAENIKSLRYGHIMIMTDQDTDGSHIKGLLINFFESSFPGLLEIPGFLLEFITPIVKVTIAGRNPRVIPFYNLPDFEHWRSTEGVTLRWTHKYYKGLGTSTPKEYIEYFTALDKHLKKFHSLQNDDSGLIDLAFSKKKADDRKEWLQSFVPGTRLDPSINEIPISDFINKELILFSMYDNVRSIPSILDGFKPGQRKVLFSCFKRNLRGEIKVASLAGYVSENSGYHHGEASLVQTIIGLAQNFIGSNNLNVLVPQGAFGSRAAGGKDASAARYIFTAVNDITRKIFNPLDNPLLTYVQDDEKYVEPEWYLPIIPMLLVNGAEGIGTGWSTNIPPYNPSDIVDNLKRLMKGEEMQPMVPWFRGWEGTLEQNGSDKFKVLGKIQQIDETTLEITELPVKLWTNNMKEFLLSALGSEKVKPWIKDFEEHHSSNISFIIKMSPEEMQKALEYGLLEKFKLIQSISLNNMVAFDPLGRIKRYESPLDIMKDYYYVRMEFYQRRKDFMADDLQNQLTKLSEQARFIKLIIEKQISLSNKKRADLVKTLESFNFVRFDKKGKPIVDNSQLIKKEDDEEEEEPPEGLFLNEEAVEAVEESKPETVYSSYDYLLGMSLWTLTKERYEKLLQKKGEIEDELTRLLSISAKDLWLNDLDEFMVHWEKFLEDDRQERANMKQMKGSSGKRKKVTKKRALTSKETQAEPAKKKATATKKAASSKMKQETSESTSLTNKPAPESAPKAAPKAAPKSLPKPNEKPKSTPSMFSDSEDDELLGEQFGKSDSEENAEESTKETAVPVKKTYSSKNKPNKNKQMLDHELEDLGVENIDTAPRNKRTQAKSKNYKIEYIDDEDEEEEDQMDIDDDDSDDEYREDD